LVINNWISFVVILCWKYWVIFGYLECAFWVLLKNTKLLREIYWLLPMQLLLQQVQTHLLQLWRIRSIQSINQLQTSCRHQGIQCGQCHRVQWLRERWFQLTQSVEKQKKVKYLTSCDSWAYVNSYLSFFIVFNPFVIFGVFTNNCEF